VARDVREVEIEPVGLRGRESAIEITERVIDVVARELGVNPVALG